MHAGAERCSACAGHHVQAPQDPEGRKQPVHAARLCHRRDGEHLRQDHSRHGRGRAHAQARCRACCPHALPAAAAQRGPASARTRGSCLLLPQAAAVHVLAAAAAAMSRASMRPGRASGSLCCQAVPCCEHVDSQEASSQHPAQAPALTRRFMADQGVHMPEALTYPENYYDIAQTMRPGASPRHASDAALWCRRACCARCLLSATSGGAGVPAAPWSTGSRTNDSCVGRGCNCWCALVVQSPSVEARRHPGTPRACEAECGPLLSAVRMRCWH